MIYPSGKRVRTSQDGRGRLSGVAKVDAGGNVLTNYLSGIGYTSAGQVSGLTLGNGVVESYGYSSDRLQLTNQTATKSGNTLMTLTYNYQATAGQSGTGTTAGNSGQLMGITSAPASTINNQARDQAFTYDNLGRLLTARGWTSWQRRFAYDRFGNRTGMWDAVTGGNQLQNIAIAQTNSVANNRIATVNSVSYSYEASGNLTNDGAHSYGYDAAGRMVSVDGGVTASYTYDANNWRVKKVAAGVTTHCVWEGSQVMAEYNGSTGALISEYIYAGARMVAREQGSVIRYYHADRLSTRLITDSNGAVVGTMDHLPFGEDAQTGAGESEKHRFTNYERDSESNTDYAVNRQHSISVGRFLQPDAVSGSLTQPQSLNRYSYSINDSVNLTDPTGLNYCPPEFASCSGSFIDGMPASRRVVEWLLGNELGVAAPLETTRWNGQTRQFEFFRAYGDGSAGWQAMSEFGWSPLERALGRNVPPATLLDHIAQLVIEVISAILTENVGNYFRFLYVAWRTGLSEHINSFQYDFSTGEFTIDFKRSVIGFLHDSPYFRGTRLGGLRHDVGMAFPYDYRSLTGELGRLSLQIVYNPDNLRRTYADFDRFNPYQDVFGFFGHIFGEGIWHKLRKIGR